MCVGFILVERKLRIWPFMSGKARTLVIEKKEIEAEKRQEWGGGAYRLLQPSYSTAASICLKIRGVQPINDINDSACVLPLNLIIYI
jgi:hypothetical protein